jgi:hypothetical protein
MHTFGKGMSAGDRVTFSQAVEQDGGVDISAATHGLTGYQTRIIARDKDGKELAPTDGSGQSSGDTQVINATFLGKRLREINMFELQTRRYEWVRFTSVSLRPDFSQPTQPATAPARWPAIAGWGGQIGDLRSDIAASIVFDHFDAYVQAQHAAGAKTALPVVSQIYTVDRDFRRRLGGVLMFVNNTNKAVTGEVSMGTFDHTDMIFREASDQSPKVRLVEKEGAKSGRYTVLWTPDKPILAGEARVLLWTLPDSRQLQVTGGAAALKMENFPGPACVENFFLVLPRGLSVAEDASHFNGISQVGCFKVYRWQDRVPANTNHVVEATIKTVWPATTTSPATQPARP